MRLLALTAALTAALVLAGTVRAESLQVKHKPWHTLTTQQKVVVLKRQIHKDKCVIRFWKNHRELASASSTLSYTARTQMHWARVSLRISSRSLHKLERSHTVAATGSDMGAWLCIHKYEGSWSDPNPPYWGGLQMDMGFQRTYGSEFLNKYGTADHWPIIDQIIAARRARDGYHGYGARGYGPWPNTARLCGLL